MKAVQTMLSRRILLAPAGLVAWGLALGSLSLGSSDGFSRVDEGRAASLHGGGGCNYVSNASATNLCSDCQSGALSKSDAASYTSSGGKTKSTTSPCNPASPGTGGSCTYTASAGSCNSSGGARGGGGGVGSGLTALGYDLVSGD